MSYIDGFALPIRAGTSRADYREFATRTGSAMIRCGATRLVECWADDVPHGERTDFYRAVAWKEGETVGFAWIEWPDKATRDAGMKAAMEDPSMQPEGPDQWPFDGARMIYGGFQPLVECHGSGGTLGYIDAFVAGVAPANRDAFLQMSQQGADKFLKHGALFDFECWGDDVPRGEVTDFHRAVRAQGDEVPGLSFVGWPDKATRDAAWGKMMEGEGPAELPFDGKRMFWGGFVPVVDLGGRT